MQTVLYVFCTILWAAGLILFFLVGNSALIQVIGCLLGISGTLMFVGGAILGAIDDLTNTLKATKE